MDLDKFFKEGALKKVRPSIELAKKDLKTAEFFLDEAEQLLNENRKHSGAIILYNAYFHIARAILMNEGIKERSHFAVARYIEENYVKTKKLDIKFLIAFEEIMSLRKDIQYSHEKIEIESNLVELFNICEEFLVAIEGIII